MLENKLFINYQKNKSVLRKNETMDICLWNVYMPFIHQSIKTNSLNCVNITSIVFSILQIVSSRHWGRSLICKHRSHLYVDCHLFILGPGKETNLLLCGQFANTEWRKMQGFSSSYFYFILFRTVISPSPPNSKTLLELLLLACFLYFQSACNLWLMAG